MTALAVFIDGSDNDEESLETAVGICKAVEGRLDVYYPVGARVPIMMATHSAIPALPELVGGEDPERTAAARAAFEAVCGGLDFARWRQTDFGIDQAIRAASFLNDIIVLERLSSDTGPDAQTLATALFDTPSPVLICPPNVPATFATSIGVVWRSNRQSARALRAAMPLMKRAQKVTVFTEISDTEADANGVVDYLATHGVKAEPETFDGSGLTARGRARALMAAANSVGADFMAMGAYGETMLSSILGLGRATLKVVTGTTIPTLIAH